jgi:hypothetical protein
LIAPDRLRPLTNEGRAKAHILGAQVNIAFSIPYFASRRNQELNVL